MSPWRRVPWAGLPLLAGCILGPRPDAGARATYEAVWADFDEHYALFDAKPDLSWEVQGGTCEALLPADDADEEALAEALRCLLGGLDDDHVRLLRPDVEDGLWSAGRLEDLERTDFSEEITGAWVDELEDAGLVRFGWVSADLAGERRLAYLQVTSLASMDVVELVDVALAELEGAEALVLDLRGNGGGMHHVLQPVASRFADHDLVYARIRKRQGWDAAGEPAYTDFVDYEVAAGEAPFTSPVALVTHPFTVSGAEHLALALRELDHVTHVGSPTAGAFAAAIWRDAPNGWLYALSVEDARDKDEQVLEGTGVEPEVEAESSLEESQAGVDLALEAAVDVLLDQL